MKVKLAFLRFLTTVVCLVCFVVPVFGATIDVMIVYDTTAKSWVSSQGGMSAFAADAVARMNQAAANSNVNLTFSLVHAAEASYTYSGSLGTDLDNLQAGAGDLSTVHQLRNTYGADLVALLVDTGSAYGTVGMAYTLTTYNGQSAYAFSTNAIRSVEISHTLTHEVGHNLGCDHSKNQKSSPGPNTYLNSYSAGWYFTGTDSTSTKYHTIMAYGSDGWGNTYTEAPLFSTPLLNYQGTPAGDAQDGDNARNIRGTMDIVAAYRSAVCTYTLSPANSTFSAASGTGSIAVTASSSSCSWTATSNDSWMTITSGSSRTGTATVTYSVADNSGAARTGTMTIADQTFTVTQAAWAYSNSIGSKNSIKVTDLSGTLPTSGGAISVKAWYADGNVISESGSAAALTLSNNGTTTISGLELAARFSTGTGTPMLYALSADSSKYIITNVKSSSDGTLNVPNGANIGTTKFVANSIGPRNAIKITDMSGTLTTPAAITVAAWATDGTSIPESSGAVALTLSNNGTTTINGTDLMARFPTGAPMSYEFTVGSSKYVITNVKSSTDNAINIPYAYTSGTTNFVANSIGPRNTLKISDVSGSVPTAAAITVAAWDANGNALSTTAAPLTLNSRGTTIITGNELAARFPPDTSPMAYEFTVGSSKYIITNVKSSTDNTINIPAVYTSGTTTYASNDISSSRSTVKITDASGVLSSAAAITVTAWDVNGTSIPESTSAAALTLASNGTTTITGADLAARFPTGTPALYEFTVGSSQYIITNVTANTAGTLTIPSVYTSGVAGGI